MIEWFLDLPVIFQILSVLLALVLIGIAGLIFSRSSVTEPGDLPTPVEEEPKIDKLYELTESPYTGHILVESVDGTDIYGELIIDLPDGARYVGLQRAYSDSNEEFVYAHFVVAYYQNGLYRTQTWDSRLAWQDYDVYPREITVRDSSVRLPDNQ